MFPDAVRVQVSRRRNRLLLSCAMVAMAAGAGAQDTRVVTEPVIPVACVRLGAHLQGVGASIREEDENKPDTERIQKAIDGCKQGQAVELTAAFRWGRAARIRRRGMRF